MPPELENEVAEQSYAANAAGKGEKFKTPQEKQFAQLTDAILARMDVGLNNLDTKYGQQIAKQAEDIAKLDDDHKAVAEKFAERFKALAELDRAGHGLRGADRERAAMLGRVVRAVVRDNADIGELQKMAIIPGVGAQGGYLVAEQVMLDLARDLETAGIFGADCPALGVTALKGGNPKGTSGFTVYYPDFGSAASASTPGFGNNAWDLKRFVAAGEVEGWMMASGLEAVLGQYIREELAYAIALAKDTNWFVGDGTSTYCGYTGLFKLAAASGVKVTTPANSGGWSTITGLVGASSKYLSLAMGSLPDWAMKAGPSWYMHQLLFFGFMGVQDTGGMPIASIYIGEGPQFRLMGLPVRIVPVAPSTTAVSTCFVVLAALKRVCRHYQHSRAIEFAMTNALEFSKWVANLTAVKCDVPTDMVVRNATGIAQVTTAAS